MINLLNNISVGVFGMILSVAYSDTCWTKRKRLLMLGGMAGIFILQGVIYFGVDVEMVRGLYPLITHVPLILILYFFSKKFLWSVISVLTAYLCCFLRRWLALLIVSVCGGNRILQSGAELVVTFPLLILLVKIVAPAVKSISRESLKVQWQFALIPALSYVFDYLTQVYTDWFSTGNPVIAEFMSFICSTAYLIFVIQTTKEKRIRSELELIQGNLNLQVAQAIREIELLRDSQTRASTYRHDLRHHMQYLLTCIQNGREEQAQEYIHAVCSEIEASKVIRYCENEAANLIFSSFVGRAKEHDITIRIKAEIPKDIWVSDVDICVLLSNALENALHACQKRKEKGLLAVIDVMAYQKNEKLFFQITNSCEGEIIFENGVPVTQNPGHGIGVRSMCALVERYDGMYSFSVKNGQFILRLSV